ncbi:MAG: tetratricopeptide repeat protein [Candidatus Pacebacteria bacterium]|nr:tetratricopeptide repeat protein [Candidatus Paceibacterota bacterium]
MLSASHVEGVYTCLDNLVKTLNSSLDPTEELKVFKEGWTEFINALRITNMDILDTVPFAELRMALITHSYDDELVLLETLLVQARPKSLEAWNSLGGTYLRQSKHKKAEECFKRALWIRDFVGTDFNDKKTEACCLLALAIAQLEQKKIPEAFCNAFEARSILISCGSTTSIKSVTGTLDDIVSKM